MEKSFLNNIYVPSEKVVSRLIEGDLIIVPVESDTVDFDHSLYSLKDIGKKIWERVNKKITVKELCHELSLEYDTSIDVIQQDVVAFLKDLLERNLIVPVKNE